MIIISSQIYIFGALFKSCLSLKVLIVVSHFFLSAKLGVNPINFAWFLFTGFSKLSVYEFMSQGKISSQITYNIGIKRPGLLVTADTSPPLGPEFDSPHGI